MPIYEYYSPDTNRIYSFFAKTLAQGQLTPRCPDNPKARMKKIVSAFAVTGRNKEEPKIAPTGGGAGGMDDAKMEAAMASMEREFSGLDENDPKAMARMMRRMSELTGEKLDEPMEEAMRKLEEGADPDSLEDSLGGPVGDESGADDPYGDGPPPPPAAEPKEGRAKFKVRRPPPTRDPRLYDYE
ncbi:MAG: FmdB family transcriptional regulator [Opitutae bacterium]|nr:FmdB family transcriptional regulator [Opitutae bacterium]